jgi:oligopeptidase B
MSPAATANVRPPVAPREEDRVVYAGVGPPGWDPKVPRQAEGSPHKLLDPPVAVSDPYGWLRDETRKNEDVIKHLNAENEHSQAFTRHLDGLRQTLYDEMLGAIQETDYTLPRPKGDWFRYSRTFEGKSYATYCRAPRTAELNIEWDGSPESPILPGEEILLDVNKLAEYKEYCSLGALAVSPSQKLLAYSVDFTGNEKYSLYVLNLETGKTVDHDPELEIDGSLVWGKNDSNLFYMKLDMELVFWVQCGNRMGKLQNGDMVVLLSQLFTTVLSSMVLAPKLLTDKFIQIHLPFFLMR